MSMWEHGDTNLDEYSEIIRKNANYGVTCVGSGGEVRPLQSDSCEGHWYGWYPIGISLLSGPLVLAIIGILRTATPIFSSIHSSNAVIEGFLRADWDAAHALIEMEVASFLLATTTIVVYFIARRYLNQKRSFLLSAFFAIGTSAYSMAGRGLWGHSPSMLLISIAVYLLVTAEDQRTRAAWAALPVALSYTVRPTDGLFVMICTCFVALHHRSQLVRYVLAAAPIAAAFFIYNITTYHSLLPSYYKLHPSFGQPGYAADFGNALAGNLLSPSRGLLIYSPVFLFAIWNMFRNHWKTAISTPLAILCLLHWVVISMFVEFWWAGHSYGPRLFTDLAPVFTFFLIPWFERWDTLSRPIRVAFVALALVSAAMHLPGGWSGSVYRWNTEPVNIDQHPGRNWDWGDPQFLRGLHL